MTDSRTTTVEIDSELLEELRSENPGTPDRELVEQTMRQQVGFSTVRRLQERFNLPEDEAMAVGVEAVREARRER